MENLIMRRIYMAVKKRAESRCLDIGEKGVSEAENCDSQCAWIQVRSDEEGAVEILEKYSLMPPISHRYDKRPVFREWDDSKIYAKM